MGGGGEEWGRNGGRVSGFSGKNYSSKNRPDTNNFKAIVKTREKNISTNIV